MAHPSEVESKFKFYKTFTAVGVIGNSSYELKSGETKVRVVVSGVGALNTVLIYGRIKNQAAWVLLSTITDVSTGTTVDTSVVDEIYFDCGVYAALGTPTVVASGFFS